MKSSLIVLRANLTVLAQSAVGKKYASAVKALITHAWPPYTRVRAQHVSVSRLLQLSLLGPCLDPTPQELEAEV